MDQYLFWLDIESTGLNENIDHMLELGISLTDPLGNFIDSREWLIPVSSRVKAGAVQRAKRDSYVGPLHMKSGLWDDLDKSDSRSEAEIESEIIDWVSSFEVDYEVPMCGSSVHFDRKFINKYMPTLHEFFHHRNIDVSSIKELCRIHAPKVYERLAAETKPQKLHRVTADIYDTVEEYRFYLANFLRPDVA